MNTHSKNIIKHLHIPVADKLDSWLHCDKLSLIPEFEDFFSGLSNYNGNIGKNVVLILYSTVSQ